MKQPDLGKKIAELRKAKGYTQEELVEKCNLSVRTLQRIEAGEVTPRSYTVKVIFATLDYDFNNSSQISYSRFSKAGFAIIQWLEQFYRYVLDLFNLKTNKMKKITILSTMFFAIIFGLIALCSETKAQSTAVVKKFFESSNENFIRWFNTGQMDSLVTLYRDNACLVARGCGKSFIKDYYGAESKKYKFKQLTVLSVSVSDSIAVEKGLWSIKLESGEEFGGEYLAEWRLINNRWLMVNELSGVKQ
jgi:transcriptional regulator with XRE-family HTH domain